MARDDRFYAFIIANTSRSRSHIRRVCVEKKSLRIFVALVTLVAGCTLYGFYGLLLQARHLRIESCARNAMSCAHPDAAGLLPTRATPIDG